MKWEQTTASKCRYGDVAGRIFEDSEIIFEMADNDYQGFANVFARLHDGRFCHYEWNYGSCSGCDDWEHRNLDGDQIEEEMRRGAAFFEDEETARKYLNGKYRNDDDDFRGTFRMMADTFDEWSPAS